jgi:hypothetical protein
MSKRPAPVSDVSQSSPKRANPGEIEDREAPFNYFDRLPEELLLRIAELVCPELVVFCCEHFR